MSLVNTILSSTVVVLRVLWTAVVPDSDCCSSSLIPSRHSGRHKMSSNWNISLACCVVMAASKTKIKTNQSRVSGGIRVPHSVTGLDCSVPQIGPDYLLHTTRERLCGRICLALFPGKNLSLFRPGMPLVLLRQQSFCCDCLVDKDAWKSSK